MATPDQIRKELANHKLPFDISKSGSSWYVTGEECTLWKSQSLNTWKVNHWSAAKWVEEIVSMAEDNRETVLEGVKTIFDQEWKANVENSIKQVDSYLEWKRKIAR